MGFRIRDYKFGTLGKLLYHSEEEGLNLENVHTSNYYTGLQEGLSEKKNHMYSVYTKIISVGSGSLIW